MQQSSGLFLEIYEERLWQARKLGRELVDPTLGTTLAGYQEALLERRRTLAEDYGWTAAAPAPTEHRFVFSAPTTGDTAVYRYVHGPSCERSSTPPFGMVIVVPDVL